LKKKKNQKVREKHIMKNIRLKIKKEKEALTVKIERQIQKKQKQI